MKLLVSIMAVVFIGSLVLRAAAADHVEVIPPNAVACANDAFKFCAQAMHNDTIMPGAIKACLRFHEKELTAECRAVLRASK